MTSKLKEMADKEILEWQEIIKRTRVFSAKYKMYLDPVIAEIEPLNPTRTAIAGGSFDISIAGDATVLGEIWGILRRNGFKPPEYRPTQNQPSFSGYFEHKDDEDCRIWLSFSSTVCRRVAVGTRMEEVTIYETRCGDEPVKTVTTVSENPF
jgi:hypothetical protein